MEPQLPNPERLLLQQLESLQAAGLTWLPRALADEIMASLPAPDTAPAESAPARTAPLRPPGRPSPAASPGARPASGMQPPPASPSGTEAMPRKPAASTASFASGSTPPASASAGSRAASEGAAPRARGRTPGGLSVQGAPWPPPTPPAKRAAALQVLADEVAGCTRCAELAATRTQTVFGVGNPQARLCFLGEAPGADEDRAGEPFVGKAGQLLNKIIEACGLRREDVYILNTLKCRPPGNRTPAEDETDACFPFLERQLAILQPEFICCLGAVGSQTLLRTKTSIGKLRKTVHDFRGIKVVCTYHPAYLLRYPAAKKDTWEDMKFLLGQMGLPVPK